MVLGGLWRHNAAGTQGYDGNHGQYSAYNGGLLPVLGLQENIVPMMVDCCQYSGYDGISCLVHWLQWWIVGSTARTIGIRSQYRRPQSNTKVVPFA